MRFIVKAHEVINYELEIEADNAEQAIAIADKASPLDWLGNETDEGDWVIDSAEPLVIESL